MPELPGATGPEPRVLALSLLLAGLRGLALAWPAEEVRS